MKFFVVSACLLVGASAIHHDIIQAKWASYKAQHGKEYHPSEEATRLNNFLRSTLQIEQHNARFHRGEVGYELGHNDMSDLSQEELNASLVGKRTISLEGFNFTDVPPMAGPLPASVDWREQNIVTPAKRQLGCGSCYAFGPLGVIESAIAQKTGKQVDLSEQQVVDCSYRTMGKNNNGCDGGHELVTINFVKKNGLVEESQYPYVSGASRHHNACEQSSGPHGKGLQFRRIPAKDEKALAEAVAQYGTIVVSIHASNSDFHLYRGNAIYDNPNCPKKVTHLMSVIGYGSEGGRDYWLVKNSYGSRWGDNGFGRVLRGNNQCGIVSEDSWSITV